MGVWPRLEISKLINAGHLVIGDGYRAKNEELSETGLPFARAGNINSGFHFQGADCFPESELRRVGNKVSQPGDVVFTSKGTVGRFALVRDETPRFVYSPQICFWRSTDSSIIDPKFLFFWMSGNEFYGQFKGVSGQTDMAEYVSLTDQRRMKISLPPVEEQYKIASILGALDDKIELNRQMNETLEAMARAIFRDWFVDFGPTRAKMAGRPPYLAPDIWSLFPNRLDAEGRPEGWRSGKLGDVAEQVGRTVHPETLDPHTPYIGLEHMPRRSIALSDWDGAGKVTSGKLAFQKGDFLFGKHRPYFHKVGAAPLDGICSTDIIVLNARERCAASFVLACISQDEFVAFTDRTSDGTKMPRTSWTRMEKYGVCLPGQAAFEAFDAIANPMFSRIVFNIHESRTLATTRDLLLPKLMSGEVRVNDNYAAVEHQLAEAS